MLFYSVFIEGKAPFHFLCSKINLLLFFVFVLLVHPSFYMLKYIILYCQSLTSKATSFANQPLLYAHGVL